ncbi:MAG TPA: phosphatase PAP2 family protein [Polyangiaceae bacterium]|nr:phosphatase PAP2 family protein [Polyangiaceae bacterium]
MTNFATHPRAIGAYILGLLSFVARSAAAQSEPAPPPKAPPFHVDPVTDGAIVALNGGFAGLLDLVIGTGELRPQQISTTFDAQSLLSIDRGAISQHVDPNAGTYSTIGLGVALGYALLDPIATGFRENSAETALVDGILYAETLTITTGVTNLAKIAVRRPRPLAYVDAQAHRNDPNYSNADTDSSLSFFSGHAATTAAVTATATYLAFVRSPKSARPWITLIAGTALTSFVSFERVRAGKHFPTDVIAGAMAGAGIGILVPHMHRNDSEKPRTIWVGAMPVNSNTGGMLTLSGLF